MDVYRRRKYLCTIDGGVVMRRVVGQTHQPTIRADFRDLFIYASIRFGAESGISLLDSQYSSARHACVRLAVELTRDKTRKD